MKRLGLLGAASLLAAVASPAAAQSYVAVPGVVNQSVADTVGAAMRREGIASVSAPFTATIAAITAQVSDMMATGGPCAAQSSFNLWLKVIKCLGIAEPFGVGAKGDMYSGSGDFGGAGSTGTWGQNTTTRPCAELKYKVDAAGNLIIPSFPLKVGGPVKVGSTAWHPADDPTGDEYWYVYMGSASGLLPATASTAQAAARRLVHLYNLKRPRIDWWGVVGPYEEGGQSCVKFATLAYRDKNNQVVPRAETQACGFKGNYGPENPGWAEAGFGQPHKSCPDMLSSGGNFHFYGTGKLDNHFHDCVWYAPNPDATGTTDGYAINSETTLPISATANWPQGMPAGDTCRLDPELLRQISDKLRKAASLRPGYGGTAYAPVTTADVRPGDARVGDLAAPPVQPQKTPDPLAQPPADAPVIPPKSTGGGGTVDLGADPAIAAPAVGEAPTGSSIVTPLFNWFPTLPTIAINTAGVACPTWTMRPFNWVLVMDSHCVFIEQNRALLSAIMVAVFTMGAAMIILRA